MMRVQAAFAEAGSVTEGLCNESDRTGEKICAADITAFVGVFNNILSLVAIGGGFLAFLALIAGGFRYLTAQGDPKAMTAARGTITWAVVGLALIIISWLILQFIAQFTGCEGILFFRISTDSGC